MNRKELQELMKSSMDECKDYKEESLEFHHYPYQDNTGCEYAHIIARQISGTNSSGDPVSYISVLAYLGKDEKGHQRFEVWCEDNFLEGLSLKLDKETRVDLAAKDIHKDRIVELTESMNKLYGSYGEQLSSSRGHYWSLAGAGKHCKHVKSMLSQLTNTQVNQLITNYNAAFKSLKGTGKTAPTNHFLAKVSKYAFKKHVCVEGEKGSGKTYSIDAYVKQNGFCTVLLGGHEGIEAIDMLGHLVRYTEVAEAQDVAGTRGNVFTTVSVPQYVDRMVWKDGPLSEAFRRAASGQETVLFIDEILRIPARELNILVAALTPNSSGEYVLRTGNILGLRDGVAVEETLIADCNKLWVVATTNVGADYQVDTIDEALVDRFRFIRKDNDRNEMKTILEKHANDKGYSSEVVSQLLSFYDSYTKFKSQGQLNRVLSVRHLSEAILFAESEDDIEEQLMDIIPILVDRNPEGYIEDDQVKLVKDSVTNAFV